MGGNPELKNLVGGLADAYDDDAVIILGKGPSLDDIDNKALDGHFVIALNDAERFAPADVAIFHEEWAADAIRDAGSNAKLYVTSTDFQPEQGDVFRVPYEPLSNDTADLMLSRVLDTKDFAIEEVMVLSALELASYVAERRGRQQTVYLLGFDFSLEVGHSQRGSAGFEPPVSGERTAALDAQQHFLDNLLYMLRDSQLKVVHVGTHTRSELTAVSFNSRLSPSRGLAPSAPIAQEKRDEGVKIIAEITTNHFGDRHRLEQLVRTAHSAGADYVKVQKRDPETFYTPEQLAAPYVSPFGTTLRDYRQQLELSVEDFHFLGDLCDELGIEWFASVLDLPSYEFMQQFDMPLIKLPSTISEHTDYLSSVAATWERGLVLSTGMTDTAFENWALSTFTNQSTLYLMHANSAYPTPDQDCNVAVVSHYSELAEEHPHIVPGYSSHDFGYLASALAVASGARLVEKHVKLGDTEWAHFDAVAVDLTTGAFHEYVEGVRRAEQMVGSKTKRVTASEHHKYRVAK